MRTLTVGVATVCLVLAGAASLAPRDAAAALVAGSTFTLNKWNGAAYTDDKTGGFSHCAVSTAYADGTTLLFGVNASGGVTIGFVRPNWAFKPGQQVQGELKIDQRYATRVIGTAIMPTMIEVDFLPTDGIFLNLARGYVPTVSSQSGTGSFKLTDSFRALQMARDCALKYQVQLGVAGQQNVELQKWLARNPWFRDPRYAAQAHAAIDITNQLTAEGKDKTTAAYYAELDERLRKIGIHASEAAAPGPVAAAAPSQPAPAAKKRTAEVNGTGFAITTDGYVVTNHHVIGDCVSDVHGNLTGESPQTLRVVSVDPLNDLALLKAPTTFKDPAIIRDPAIHPGDGVIAIGYPYYGILSSEFTVTTGIISSLGGIRDDSRYFQISAPVQPGNSGGPLLDQGGNVVGVVSEKLDAIRVAKVTGTIPENVNFAIKTGPLRDFLDKNAVSYQTAASQSGSTTADIARRARAYVLLLTCTAVEPAN